MSGSFFQMSAWFVVEFLMGVAWPFPRTSIWRWGWMRVIIGGLAGVRNGLSERLTGWQVPFRTLDRCRARRMTKQPETDLSSLGFIMQLVEEPRFCMFRLKMHNSRHQMENLRLRIPDRAQTEQLRFRKELLEQRANHVSYPQPVPRQAIRFTKFRGAKKDSLHPLPIHSSSPATRRPQPIRETAPRKQGSTWTEPARPTPG